MAGNLLMSISQDERERAVFRSRRMYQTDQQSNIATAEDRGERRSLARGRAETMTESIRNLMDSLGLSMEQAMSALKVPDEERMKYKELLGG